jgi:polyisoprenoid-binding protein YceI
MLRARPRLTIIALLMTLAAAESSRAQSAPVVRYGLNPSASLVAFTICTQGLFKFKREGRFHDVAGELTYDPARPAGTHLDLVVYTASVDMNNAEHTELLKSRDFFDSDDFPTMRFSSARVVPTSDGSMTVEGDLTIRGITKRIAIPVALRMDQNNGKPVARFDTTFEIDRTEFGLNGVPKWNGFNVSISKRVQIHVNIAGMRAFGP